MLLYGQGFTMETKDGLKKNCSRSYSMSLSTGPTALRSKDMEAKSHHVLVIERKHFMRKYITRCVLQCGDYGLIAVKDLDSAHRLIKEKQPLVIIFDLQQGSGYDIAHLIESARTISVDYLPYFIAVSSVDDSTINSHTGESGADFYLPKKFSTCHIRGILNSIMRLDNFRTRIRENECYYRTMFQKAGDAVMIVSLPDLVIHNVNPEASRVYGYLKQDFLALKFSHLTENISSVREKLLNKVTFLTNVRQKRKHGEVFPASLAFAYFKKNGQPLVIITVKDLSEAERHQEANDALLDFKRIKPDKAGREILAVLRGEQNERRRISREIHDHIGQQLVSIKLEFENQVVHAAHNTCRSDMLSLRDQMVSAISSLRKLSSNIAGDYLPYSDWIESVRELTGHMTRKKKINITLNPPESTPTLTAFVQGHVYRIIEESLTNAIKHSAKKSAIVNIKPENNSILLVEIISHGLSGENESTPSPGIGMRIMQQRARLIKSGLLFEMKGHDTFVVQLSVPVND